MIRPSDPTLTILGRVARRPSACRSTGQILPGYLHLCRRRADPELLRCREKLGQPGDLQPRVRIALRGYQETVFNDRTSGILILHWSRQIGKSFTLAAWAVDRLLTRPGRLVTVLSNSRENGAEFVAKCAEVCHLNGTRFESEDQSQGVQFQNMRHEIRIRAQGKTGRIKVLAANPRTARGFSGDLILDEFAFHEDSAAIWEAAEPILASNPDYLCRIASPGNGKHNLFYRMTAPALGREPQISTFDGPRVCDPQHAAPTPASSIQLDPQPASASDSPLTHPPAHSPTHSATVTPFTSQSGYKVSRVTRTQAHASGVPIYDPNTREPITPEQARSQALDKRAYDQNYECSFADENLTLLSHELISAAERDDVGVICEQDWSSPVVGRPASRDPIAPSPSAIDAEPATTPDPWLDDVPTPSDCSPLQRSMFPACGIECSMFATSQSHSLTYAPTHPLSFLRSLPGPLYLGFDVGRKVDLSVITVIEKLGSMIMVRAILRMQNLRLPDQQLRLGEICRLPQFRRAAIDMTGLGLGLFEYAQKQFGASKIQGINFATTVPASKIIALEGRKRETVRVTEALAVELLQAYEDRRIQHPADARLRDDLRKPEKITTPGGRVSIAACRDEAGHADHFWSFALALEAAAKAPAPFAYQAIPRVLGRSNRHPCLF